MINEFRLVIRDFVFGMEDGLVSNLGLVLGVYIGGGGTYAIILSGMASMVAGAFSMSAGSYLSAKSQREVYEQEISSTKAQLKHSPKTALREMHQLLNTEGFNENEIKTIMHRFEHSPSTMTTNYLQKKGLSEERLDLPLRNAFTMFFSFLAGSMFPIVPFLIYSNSTAAITATVITIATLFLVGWAKTKYTRCSWFKSGLEIVLIGLGAGVLGYLVGWLIRFIFSAYTV